MIDVHQNMGFVKTFLITAVILLGFCTHAFIFPLRIASFEFANLKYFNSTFMNLKNARLVLNAKCEIVVFTSVIVL